MATDVRVPCTIAIRGKVQINKMLLQQGAMRNAVALCKKGVERGSKYSYSWHTKLATFFQLRQLLRKDEMEDGARA